MTDGSLFRDKYSRQAENFRIGFAEECAGDPEFKAYCDEHIEWLNNKQAELDVMFAHADEVGLGSMFENSKGDRWAVVFPDASFPSKFRYQVCGREGWTSHSTFDTFDQVIYEAHSSGFIKPVSSDMLLALADTRQWKEGVEITGVIDQINRGLISYKDGHNKIMQIKEAYAKDAGKDVPGPGKEHSQAGGSQTVNDPWENTVQDDFEMQIAAGKELLDKVDLQIQNSADNEDQPTKKKRMRMG